MTSLSVCTLSPAPLRGYAAFIIALLPVSHEPFLNTISFVSLQRALVQAARAPAAERQQVFKEAMMLHAVPLVDDQACKSLLGLFS